jgi:hypothetical protein
MSDLLALDVVANVIDDLGIRERRHVANVGEVRDARVTRRMVFPERVLGMSETIQTQ